jgi:hypothetical protein
MIPVKCKPTGCNTDYLYTVLGLCVICLPYLSPGY